MDGLGQGYYITLPGQMDGRAGVHKSIIFFSFSSFLVSFSFFLFPVCQFHHWWGVDITHQSVYQ